MVLPAPCRSAGGHGRRQIAIRDGSFELSNDLFEGREALIVVSRVDRRHVLLRLPDDGWVLADLDELADDTVNLIHQHDGDPRGALQVFAKPLPCGWSGDLIRNLDKHRDESGDGLRFFQIVLESMLELA